MHRPHRNVVNPGSHRITDTNNVDLHSRRTNGEHTLSQELGSGLLTKLSICTLTSGRAHVIFGLKLRNLRTLRDFFSHRNDSGRIPLRLSVRRWGTHHGGSTPCVLTVDVRTGTVSS